MSKESSNEKERKSLRQKYAEEGCLNAAFTQNSWFVKIKPAYNIDKVAFHFVTKGSSGKKSFTVYVDIDIFDLWMDDIKSFRLAKVIAEEQKNGEKYPKAYKDVSGENGSCTVGICASSKFPNMYVLNGSGKHKENGMAVGDKLYASVPVSYDWLRITAKYFDRTCRKRFSELSEIIVKESAAWHSPDQGVVSDESTASTSDSCPNGSNETTATKPNSSQSTADNKAAKDSTPDASNAKSGKNTQSKGNVSTTSSAEAKSSEQPVQENPITYNEKSCKKMEIDIKTPLQFDGNHYRLQALNPKGEQQNVVITKGVSEKLGDKFTDLVKACKQASAAKNYIHLSLLYRTGTYGNANVIFLEKIAE